MTGRAGVILTATCLLAGCGGGDPPPPALGVLVATELTTVWDLLPHRISRLEIGVDARPDGLGGTLRGQNEGGPAAVFDTATNRQAFTAYRGAALRATALSVELEIPGPGSTDPDAFVASGEARGNAAALAGADVFVAWLVGFRISTDEYATPPAFSNDPTLPYDPSSGFTSQGIGIQIGEPDLDGSDVVVPVSVRNSLGVADRADMNAAVPQASSWVRADLVVVGAAGVAAAMTRAETTYTLGTATYGKNTVHPHADDAAELVTLAGAPGMRAGLLGLSGFDIWLNAPGHIDPGCVVIQDPVNSFGDPVSGPGRYVTELGARLLDPAYDPDTGIANARVDLYFSNRSTVKEIGNVCLGLRGQLSMLQVQSSVEARAAPPIEIALPQGEVTRQAFTVE